jgi:NitT/TauT family transport system substrate-binding protein
MKNYYLILLLLLLSVFKVLAKESINVGYLPILDHLPLVVAHANDNEKSMHINVIPKKFKSWSRMVGAFNSGAIDAAFILAPLAIDMYSKKPDLQTILLSHRDGSAITVKVGSGINSAMALKGKTIAIPAKLSTHNALLNQYLNTSNLSLSDVKTPVIAPPHMEIAMKKGAIDAFIVAEPFGAKAQTNDVGKILVMTSQIEKEHIDCIVIVKKEYLKKHQKGIQEWVDSLIRAGKFIDIDKLENNSKKVSSIASQSHYMGHQENIIINGLQMPSDRISFSNLNPDISGFITILNMSIKAKILKNIDIKDFVNETFYQKSSEK